MNYNKLFNELAENNSRIFKEEKLSEFKNDEILKTIFQLALSPFVNFYIRKIPSYQSTEKTALSELFSDGMTLPEALESLSSLSSRKVTGNAGIAHLKMILESLNSDDAAVIERIIKKDLKCGVNISTTNKIWPGLIPEYPIALCSQYDKKLIDEVSWPAMVQLKEDGMRANAITSNDNVEYKSRAGKELDIYQALNSELILLKTCLDLSGNKADTILFDGEFIVVDENNKLLPRKESNGILNKANKGTITKDEAERIRFVIWDAIPYTEVIEGKSKEIYLDRVKNLISFLTSNFIKISFVPHHFVNSLEETNKIFNSYLEEGKEGIILKTLDGIWENKRLKSQIKFKAERECDLKVKAWKEGEGKYKNMLGSLECESEDGKIVVSVGSGLTDDDRKTITNEIVGKIIKIYYNERIINSKGEISLFLPVFDCIREDKITANFENEIK